MSDAIKRFIEVFVSSSTCNLKCSYCYLSQRDVQLNKTAHFNHAIETMISAINKERLGGTCMFNIVADGETMLDPTTMQFIYGALKNGHYVNIVTNATLTKRFNEVLSWPSDLLARTSFLASFHYIELKNNGLLDTYFNNLINARNAGCSFYMSMVLCKEYIECTEDIKKLCIEKIGCLPQPVRVRDENDKNLSVLTDMNINEYYDFGIKKYQSPYLQFEKDFYQKKIKTFCYAGDWFVYLDLCTGDMRACYNQPVFANLFENPNSVIPFYAIGNHCKTPYCYNGISRIPFGVIPKYKNTKFYWEYRSRSLPDGTDSYTDTIKQATQVRLYQTNKPYSPFKKIRANLKYEFNYAKLKPVKSFFNKVCYKLTHKQ